MSELSWIDRATDSAFELGRRHSEECFDGMPFWHTRLWHDFRKRYQDEMTEPEERAFQHVTGLAFSLGRKYPDYRNWNDLAAGIGGKLQPSGTLKRWPSRQIIYSRIRDAVELYLEIDPDEVTNKLGELMDDMGFTCPASSS